MKSKTLLLLRHAKSSWKDPQLDDHDRPLNSRGRKAAVKIGRLMQDERLMPDLALCSTARRARETAGLIFAEMASPPEITFRDDLYHADPEHIARVLSQVAESTSCVLMIGHNPGLEEFLSRITSKALELPTAALARVDFQVSTWSQFNDSARGTLVQLWRPRELDSD
jgi:phosphohistidine phosphatase